MSQSRQKEDVGSLAVPLAVRQTIKGKVQFKVKDSALTQKNKTGGSCQRSQTQIVSRAACLKLNSLGGIPGSITHGGHGHSCRDRDGLQGWPVPPD